MGVAVVLDDVKTVEDKRGHESLSVVSRLCIFEPSEPDSEPQFEPQMGDSKRFEIAIVYTKSGSSRRFSRA